MVGGEQESQQLIDYLLGEYEEDTDKLWQSNIFGKSLYELVSEEMCIRDRNYSDAGSLIDNLFVQMGVRFISLAENVDSYRDPDSVSSIIVPITNVMNDQYIIIKNFNEVKERESKATNVIFYRFILTRICATNHYHGKFP